MPKKNSRNRRQQRRQDAESRQAQRNQRTDVQQLAVLASRITDGHGGAYRETHRLGGN